MVVLNGANEPTHQEAAPPPYTPIPENEFSTPETHRPNVFPRAESSQSHIIPPDGNTHPNVFPPVQYTSPQTSYQSPASFPLQDVHASQQTSPPMHHEPVRLCPPAMPQSPARPKTQAEVEREYQDRSLARCARGQHDPSTKFGLGGIIAAVLLFPVGFICLCLDKEIKCSRCGFEVEH